MTESRVAFITGITGQTGSYLAEILLDKGYVVYGMVRRSSFPNTQRIDHIFKKLHLRYGDLTDQSSIQSILSEIKKNHTFESPLEIYNLGAQSHVLVSFKIPKTTAESDAMGTLYLLEAIKSLDMVDKCRIYQACTSELYGKVAEIPQNENTPMNPRSPYAIAKRFALDMCKLYREAYGMYVSNGILFNHESPRRAINFVTRKITIGVGKILRGEIEYLEMGNLNSLRDWGHAKDYARAMWMMLQQDKADDFVIATGKQYSVREFIERIFQKAGIAILWRGEGLDEEGYDSNTGRVLIKVNPKYFRPCEVDTLLGDCSKAKEILKWEPEISFEQLIEEMCEQDFISAPYHNY